VYYFENRVESATYFDDPKYGPPNVVPPNGRSGQASFALKVNKSCALDTMDAVVQLGNVSQITGWEAGPPDSAAATATWEASCRETRVKKTQGLLGEVSWTTGSTVCVVSFHPRAMAYCPVGISPDPVSLKAQGAPPRLR
jgi:hypothetical protein